MRRYPAIYLSSKRTVGIDDWGVDVFVTSRIADAERIDRELARANPNPGRTVKTTANSTSTTEESSHARIRNVESARSDRNGCPARSRERPRGRKLKVSAPGEPGCDNQ